jgi:hypothetical protein
MLEQAPCDTASAHDVPSQAAPAETRLRGAITALWHLRWLTLALLAFIATWSTAFGAGPARLLPVVLTAVDVTALSDADTPGPEREHGLRDIGAPADVELDATELDEQDERQSATCLAGGGGSPATTPLASREADLLWRAETAATPSPSVRGTGSPRGPPV